MENRTNNKGAVTTLLSSLAQFMDASWRSDGRRVVLAVTSIFQDYLLEFMETDSGRPLIGAELTALEVKTLHTRLYSRNKNLKTFCKYKGLRQLLLQCLGHPRAVLDAFPNAFAQNADKSSNPPHTATLVKMRIRMIQDCKWKFWQGKLSTNLVQTWFRGQPLPDESVVQMGRPGALQTIARETFMLPLLLAPWCNCSSPSLLQTHLRSVYFAY